MRFPEERLDLPSDKGGGYYPATIHQKLNENKYEIIRKLGYSYQSSTWLVLNSGDGCYYALKIFTSAASERANNEVLPILKSLRGKSVPVFHGSFWENRGDESHLCVLMNLLSPSIGIFQGKADDQRLPVHTVQKIVRSVADALEGLHGAKIMHGSVVAGNIFFSIPSGPEWIKPILDSEPAPKTTKNMQYVTVGSQPLTHNFQWHDKIEEVVDWPLCLGGFGHAQQSSYETMNYNRYLSAPETLLENVSCSPQTDIWMLGSMVFHLLTGKALSYSKESVSTRIATMRAILEDEVPEEWLSDRKMKDYDATNHEPVTSIEKSLSSALYPRDAVEAAVFIKSCLRMDPTKRLTATECTNHKWLSTACSGCEFGEYSI